MSILDKVKNLVTGESNIQDMATDTLGDVTGNLDIGGILTGLLDGGDLSLDTLGKAIGPFLTQIAGDDGKKEIDTVVGNLTEVTKQGIDEPSIVKSVINFLQENNVTLDTMLDLLKKIPIAPTDIIKFLGLPKK